MMRQALAHVPDGTKASQPAGHYVLWCELSRVLGPHSNGGVKQRKWWIEKMTEKNYEKWPEMGNKKLYGKHKKGSIDDVAIFT